MADSNHFRFTCLSCQVAFETADAQREHHKTDWHRYNLKRKVADLPPVTAEVFHQRVVGQKASSVCLVHVDCGIGLRTEVQELSKKYSAHCRACK